MYNTAIPIGHFGSGSDHAETVCFRHAAHIALWWLQRSQHKAYKRVSDDAICGQKGKSWKKWPHLQITFVGNLHFPLGI